jgi:hypothetical protein
MISSAVAGVAEGRDEGEAVAGVEEGRDEGEAGPRRRGRDADGTGDDVGTAGTTGAAKAAVAEGASVRAPAVVTKKLILRGGIGRANVKLSQRRMSRAK